MSNRKPWGGGGRATRAVQKVRDKELDRLMGKKHRFTIYKLGMDVCAVCQKPRKDHQ